MLGGLALGPSLFGGLWPELSQTVFPDAAQPYLQLLAKLGLILLMFQVGMEFDFSHFRNAGRSVALIALMGMITPLVGGLVIGPWLHRSFAPAAPFLAFQLFICLALSISALPIMGRILLEFGLETRPMSVIALSAAAMDDAVGWVLLAVAVAIATSGFDLAKLVVQLLGVGAFLAVVYKVIGPWLRRRWLVASSDAGALHIPSGFLALLLIVLFGCALTTNLLGLFSIFGSFVLGTALHREKELVKCWRSALSGFVLVALVPVFFTNTGLRTSLGQLQGGTAWLGCLIVMFTAIATKLGGCWLGARWGGLSKCDAACVATLMNTRALMGLVAINTGHELGLLSANLYSMFVLMAIGTTVMTGPLLLRLLRNDTTRIHCPETSSQ